METINKLIDQYNLKEPGPTQLIRESADNFVYSVGARNKKILRISKRLPIKDVQFEFEIFDYLSKHNFPVPKWNKTKDGKVFANQNGQISVLFDFIDGYHVKVDKDNLPNKGSAGQAPRYSRSELKLARPRAKARGIQPLFRLRSAQMEMMTFPFGSLACRNKNQAHTVGKYLALFHNLGLDFRSASPRKRNIYSELERALGKREFFENQFEGGKEFVKQVEMVISFAKKEKPITGLMHGDLRPDNVFFRNDNEISGFIDLDWSCVGPQIKDLALAIVEWSFPIPGRTEPDWEIFDSFLDGYNSAARNKYEKGLFLYSWIKFTTLSDASTYFCDRIDDPDLTKRIINSYMYRKYKFFSSLS